jgi:glycosyltransferase involved in cell wall biosynthesis
VRIAFLVSSYYPQVGGIESHVRRIAEGCSAAGDEVTVLTHGRDEQMPMEMIGQVRVLRFPLTVPSRAYPFSLKLLRYLRHHAAEFDLVHAHSYHTLVGQSAVGTGLPFVFTPHYHGTGHTPVSVLFHRVYRPVGARLFTESQAIICVSKAERELVLQNFPSAADKVVTIPNGTDLRCPVSVLNAEPNGSRIVLTVGRLERYKNVDLIIKAFRALPSAATLVIVGSGPDRNRLEQIARSGEDGWPIRFTGKIPDEELDALLAQANVVVSASDHEAFGLVLADGLRAGARVVASDIPAHREVGELAGVHAPVTFIDPRQTPRFAGALTAALTAGRVQAGSIQLPSWADVTRLTRQVHAQVSAASGHLAGRTARNA